MTVTLRPRTVRLAALVLGLLSATGFAPLGLWPVTVFAIAGFAWLLWRTRTLAGAAILGWCLGMGQFVLGLNWIATAFTYQAAMPAWLGWVAVVLLSIYLSIWPALAAAAAWWGARRLGGSRVTLALLLAAAWIANEGLRATVFTGFAWNPLAAVLVDMPAATLLLPWIGTYALSGLVVLWAGAMMAAARWRLGLLAAFLLPWLAGYGAMLAAGGARPVTIGPLLRIVQPNIGQDEKWRADAAALHFATLAALSGRPGPEPRLVLWPEAAVPDYLEDEPWARQRLASLLGPRDLLLTGGVALVYDRGRVTGARNSLFVIDPAARILGRYDKAHLVPYGEYLPMRPLLSAIGLSRLAPGDLDFAPGPGPRDVTLPGIGPVGIQICYEMVFSGQVVDRAHRPRFLFNPSNDAWFGAWGPVQHLAQARLRAAEEGLPIVRSTPTGISAVIDARGRLLDSLGWRRPGAIEARLPAALPPTLFAQAGNLLAVLVALLMTAAAIARPRARRYMHI